MASASGIVPPTANALAPLPVRRVARFGAFEFDAGAQELRKHGLRLKLQGKPMQLLAALIATPGEVLSREELQRRLWSADTFVDFENGLNTAAKRLRAALSDSADQPVYVETVARTGYRFIAPVVWQEDRPASVVTAPSNELPDSNWRQRRMAIIAAVAAGSIALAMVSWRSLAPRAADAQPAFRQVTFQRGPVFNARFAPDGQSIIYSAQWDTAPRQLYLNNGVSPEARPLGLPGSLFSVSRGGELALYRHNGTMPIAGGDLLRVAMNGGAPSLVEKGVMSADWAPDGTQLAITRAAGGRNTLEYPPGRVLYSTPGWLSGVRFSPSGDRLAFVDHPVRHDDGGKLFMVDAAGHSTALTPHWTVLTGLAWRPDGSEVWFSGAQGKEISSLWAASRTRGLRQLGRFPGVIRLRDVSPTGAVLLGRESLRLESVANFAGQPAGPRDVSWLDWSRAVDVSSDGRVLLDESGEAVGGQGTVYLFDAARGTQKLGEGWAQSLSPDGRQALILSTANRKDLRVVSLTSGGEPVRSLPSVPDMDYQWARFYPDGRSLLALGSLRGQPLRLYRIPPEPAAAPVPLSPPGMIRHTAISPDGAQVAYLSAEGTLVLTPSGRVLASDQPLAPLRWTMDGRKIYVQHLSATAVLPARVSLIDVGPGPVRLQAWREFTPRDPVGVDQLTRILISPDERATVFTVRRILSELFVAQGLR